MYARTASAADFRRRRRRRHREAGSRRAGSGTTVMDVAASAGVAVGVGTESNNNRDHITSINQRIVANAPNALCTLVSGEEKKFKS